MIQHNFVDRYQATHADQIRFFELWVIIFVAMRLPKMREL